MPWWTLNKTFFSRKYKLCRFACFISDKSWINFHYCGLFCTKSTTNSRLNDSDFRLWNVKSSGNNSSGMEWNLCRRDGLNSSINIYGCKSTKYFHHRLAYCLYVIRLVNSIITFRKNFVDISVSSALRSTDISLYIIANITFYDVIIFWVNNNRIINRLCKIKQWL